MKIAILGTGMVGRTLAEAIAAKRHDVVIGTRDVEARLASRETGNYGIPPFSVWHDANPSVSLLAHPDAVEGADLVLNASKGLDSMDVLQSIGNDRLSGKILLDIANPLDFSQGMPPTLAVVNSDSLAEQIQRAFPETKVVKSLNTLNAELMLNPMALADGDHDVFLSGNDAEAKRTVTAFLKSFGWTRVIDLGDITTARGTEMLLPIWVRLYGVYGDANFNFKIVRD